MVSTHWRVLVLLAALLSGCADPDDAMRGEQGAAGSPSVAKPPSEGAEADCGVTAPAAYAALPSNAKLPDPFTSVSGARVIRKSDWRCRRAELAAQIQEYELGPKPKPPESVSGRVSDTAIEVTVRDAGKTLVFTAAIAKPLGARAPYPAMIGLGGVALDSRALGRLGVAIITFKSDEMAAQESAKSRGQGKFYELYGNDHGAGAMMAWAWGVSRLIDALEQTPESGIDTKHLGVTGCARSGKGALVAGAFDERIALTIPQESGAGGAAAWRISDAQRSSGHYVQTLSEITRENCWFRSSFRQFGDSASKLPFDHHQLLGLVAPRGLLVIENTSMAWLGNQSCYLSAAVAQRTWQALGVPDDMGMSQVGGHDHCDFPKSQQPEVTAYVKKFLLDDAGIDTRVMKTDGSFSQDASAWTDWTTPTLY